MPIELEHALLKRLKIKYYSSDGDGDKKSALDSASSLPTVINVWRNIEPFLCIEDTIAMSKTCKQLHDLIIDRDSKKVKVSQFTSIRERTYAQYLT